MKRRYAGQKVGDTQPDDGCEYRLEPATHSTYYLPLYIPNNDITTDCGYFLEVSTARFCLLMDYFTHQAGLVKYMINEMPLNEIGAWIRDVETQLSATPPDNTEYNDLKTEKFALNVAKLAKLSQLRINMNAEYCGILATGPDEAGRARLDELFRESKNLISMSEQTFVVLDEMRHESFLDLKTSGKIDFQDIDTLLHEAISEIFKIPPIKPSNPDYNIPSILEFIPVAKKTMVQLVYNNRASKTAEACGCIDDMAGKMLEAAERLQPGEFKPVKDAVNKFIAAARCKTAIAVRDPDYGEAKGRFNLASESLSGELGKVTGFIELVGKAAFERINDGIKIIEKITEAKRSLPQSATKFKSLPNMASSPDSAMILA